MTQSYESAVSRLNNIETIKPLLSALRTLSMGAWQMALNKLASMVPYEENFEQILIEILKNLDITDFPKDKQSPQEAPEEKTIILIVGTERGLCGKYNTILAENTLRWAAEHEIRSYEVWAIGSKLIKVLDRMHIVPSWKKPVPVGGLLSYQESYITTQDWLDRYESYEFNQLFIHFNEIQKGGLYTFSSFQLLPYQSPQLLFQNQESSSKWPPPIIESDPVKIYRQIIEHNIASSYFKILLSSSAAENSSRYRLMQEAEENSEEIIAELTQVINAERKRKITQEMQELATGAGLLNRQ